MKDNSHARVAIIARLDHPGGVQSVVLSLIKGLNQRGILPELVWDIPPGQQLLETKGVRAGYQAVNFPMPSRFLDRAPITARYFLSIFNIFTEREIPQPYDFYFIFYNGFLVSEDMPHLRYLSGPPLLPQLDQASPGLRGLPYRFLRGMYRTVLYKRFPVYEYHRNSRYVINAEYTAHLFEEAHGVRLPVVHPPIDLSGRSFTGEDIHKRDTFTYFSRFVDYKRPDMFLQLADCFPAHRFVLMGGVKQRDMALYESLREQVKGRENIIFYRNPTDRKVKEELARTRFYVFPAVNEHFGMATAEAIASGAIPYVHDSGGQREVVPDRRLRFTDDQFIDRFSALLHLSPDLLNGIRFALREHVNRFSEDAFITRIMEIGESKIL